MRKLLTIVIVTCSFSSLIGCSYMFNELITPNQCLHCMVMNQQGDIFEEWDECGGGTSNLELECKAKAYDMGCDYICDCRSYRKEPDEED